MPNGGSMPACVHCQWLDLKTRTCTYHHFKVGIMIPYLFCNDLFINNEAEWVKSEVDLFSLTPRLLYYWVLVEYIDTQGVFHHTFSLYPLDFIRHYANWTKEEESDMLVALYTAHRQEYKKLGFKVR